MRAGRGWRRAVCPGHHGCSPTADPQAAWRLARRRAQRWQRRRSTAARRRAGARSPPRSTGASHPAAAGHVEVLAPSNLGRDGRQLQQARRLCKKRRHPGACAAPQGWTDAAADRGTQRISASGLRSAEGTTWPLTCGTVTWFGRSWPYERGINDAKLTALCAVHHGAGDAAGQLRARRRPAAGLCTSGPAAGASSQRLPAPSWAPHTPTAWAPAGARRWRPGTPPARA